MTNDVIKCGKGWESLYMPIVEKIIEHDSQQNEVKDKIGIYSIDDIDGALTILVINKDNLTHELMSMILDASQKSLSICSYCGTTKEIGTTMNDEYHTCCKSCWQENILKYNPKSIWKCYETNKFYKNIN